ncbi:penicillin-binding protein 2 [Acidithiobacillus sulfuriphilus]|uniref:penicillin-binding protein 2 n=1 Tax=Acidithiobacillus sulfuriphilus TaxID=1867749 RepID=UPI003F61CFB1
MDIRQPQREQQRFSRRMVLALGLIAVMTAILLGQLLKIQVLQHPDYATQSTRNAIALLPIAPARGLILDRHGQVLADNRVTFTLAITPNTAGDLSDTIGRLRSVLPVSGDDLEAFQRDLGRSHPYQPVVIRRNLSAAELAAFAVHRHEFPGIELQARLKRFYPYGSLFAHVVGYVGHLTPADLDEASANHYAGIDYIGKNGLEAEYEEILRGEPGNQNVEVDARGRPLRTLRDTPPKQGENLTVTLDLALQQAAARAMGTHSGAVVALDPANGEVLVAYSSPAFDPNAFVDGLSGTAWAALQDDPATPMTNRFLRGAYPPGSTIKPFIALVALQNDVITPDEKLPGGATYQIPGSTHKYYDWKPGGHGAENLGEAIRDSNDVYFYQLAMRLGIARLSAGLAPFGFGKLAGIDLPGEAAAVLPSPEWLQRRYHQPWYQGQTVMVGIGQGYLLATPLQLARATAAIANGGKLVTPHLVRSNADIDNPADAIPQGIGLSAAAMSEVQTAMRAVVTSGTAHNLANDPNAIAAKTGTSQVRRARRNDAGRALTGDPTALQDHALFIAYAPADHPRIAVAVIVEHGGHGGSAAGPIARAVIDAYLQGSASPLPTPGATP